MAEEFARCSAGIVCLFCVVFYPIAGLQISKGKLKLVSTTSSLSSSWRSLKECLSHWIFCSKLSPGKCSAQMHKCSQGRKAILFISISHFPLSLGSWGNFKVLTLDFERFFSEDHCEPETKTVSNFPHFLSSTTVTSQVSFLTTIQQFFRSLYDYEG